MTQRLTVIACVVLTSVVAVGLVRAQENDEPERPVLHEYFDPGTAFIPGSPDSALAGAAGQDPTSDVIHSGVRLPTPSNDVNAKPDEATLGPEGATEPGSAQSLPDQNGPSRPQDSSVGLDDDTDREGMLNYVTVFNPSVVPFKRAGVMDAIVMNGTEPRLALADELLRRVDVVGDDQDNLRDRFWGSFSVSSKAGELIPVPSVAPGARILEVETTPSVAVEFFVDGADNMYVTFEADGDYRLNFLTDADPGYFGLTSIPSGIRMKDINDYRKAPALPGEMRDTARALAKMVGVNKRDEVGVALPMLVEYFRDFESRPLDPEARTGNLLLDVATAKRGVCRHRAFAFVATAHYLGMPARYVYNEAHAFVEVFVPLRGWLRVDLGGGAEGLQVGNAENKIRHEPRQDTGFPEPDRYLSEYSAVSGGDPASSAGFENVDGMPPHPSEITETAAESGAPSVASDVGAAGTPGSAGTAADVMASTPPPLSPNDGTLTADPPDSTPPTPGTSVSSDRKTVQIRLQSIPDRGLRGKSIRLAGTLISTDEIPLTDQAVHIVLSPMGGTSGELTTLATVRTDAVGVFSAEVDLPQTIPVGKWDLYVFFEGNTHYLSARSE